MERTGRDGRNNGTWTSKGSITALSLRDQIIFKMNEIGEYEIHEAILELKDTARPDTAI